MNTNCLKVVDTRRFPSRIGRLKEHLLFRTADADVRVMHGHTASVKSITYSPDGQRLASGSDDGTVRVWDVSTGQQVVLLSGPQEIVYCVDWSHDGNLLASGGTDGNVRIWDGTP